MFLAGQPKLSLKTGRICHQQAHRRWWLPPRAQAPCKVQIALRKCHSSSSASRGVLALHLGS